MWECVKSSGWLTEPPTICLIHRSHSKSMFRVNCETYFSEAILSFICCTQLNVYHSQDVTSSYRQWPSYIVLYISVIILSSYALDYISQHNAKTQHMRTLFIKGLSHKKHWYYINKQHLLNIRKCDCQALRSCLFLMHYNWSNRNLI